MCLFKRIFVNGKQVAVAQDGFFEVDLKSLSDITVEVFPTKTQAERSFAFTVAGREKVITVQEWLEDGESMKVGFKVNLNLQKIPQYPGNHLKVFALGSTGDFSIYEISVVRQEDRFFLCQQVTHRGSCYRNREGEVFCPYFASGLHQWTALMPYIEKLAREFVGILPPIGAYREPKEISLSIHNGHAFVSWYNIASGTGVAMVRLDGEVQSVKLYWRHIANRTLNGLRFVPEGKVITFGQIEPLPNPKGLTHQLVGVNLAA